MIPVTQIEQKDINVSGSGNKYVTEYEETRLKTQFPIVYNAHIKVKYVFYFLLKSNLLSDKTKTNILQDNAVC